MTKIDDMYEERIKQIREENALTHKITMRLLELLDKGLNPEKALDAKDMEVKEDE